MVDISTLGQSISQISRLKVQQEAITRLSIQLSTGKKTDSFAELGVQGITSQRARASINSIDTYLSNIVNTNRRIEQIDLSLNQIQNQARTLLNSLTVTPQQGDYPEFEVIQDLADNVYNLLQDLVNTQDGDRYVFAGADAGTQPLNDTGLFRSFLGEFVPDETDLTAPPLTASGVFGQWGSGFITTDQFISAYRGVTDTTLGYSAPLASGEAGQVFARVDDTVQIDYTILGNTEGIRDIIVGLGVLRDLPPPEFAPGALNDPTATTLPDDAPPSPPSEKQQNFFQVIDDLRQLISGGVDKLQTERFELAQVQVQIDQLRETFTFEKKTFQDTIAETEDVDITDVAARINSAQIQLEASYAVTASISQITLVNFLN